MKVISKTVNRFFIEGVTDDDARLLEQIGLSRDEGNDTGDSECWQVKPATVKAVTDTDPLELYAKMTDIQRDTVYRKALAEKTAADISSRIEHYYALEDHDVSDEEIERRTRTAAELYARGRVDNDLSYWDNIDSLIHDLILTD
jgi:hypothetical protein